VLIDSEIYKSREEKKDNIVRRLISLHPKDFLSENTAA
jgi:hypothetical protein